MTLRPHALRRVTLSGALLAVLVAGGSLSVTTTRAAQTPFIAGLHSLRTLASTVPANGDQNPYGIVTAPVSAGLLHRGDILGSNFNDRGPTDSNGIPSTGGEQGRGTTIVQFNPDGSGARLFARVDPGSFPGGVGLTTALAALPNGYVVVGSLPTADGTNATATAGALIVLDPRGRVVERIAGGPIDGPWDMTARTTGPITTLFVTNVLNGTVAASPATVDQGTVVRIRMLTVPGIRPIPFDEQVIATGFPERTDAAALVVGPTGLALGEDGTLYVADTAGNRIAAIAHAMWRQSPAIGGGATLTAGGSLNGPLGMTLAPNGDLLTVNGGDGNIVETSPAGTQVAPAMLDSNNGNGAGDLFGLTVPQGGGGVLFVDDFDNTLRLLH